ncbi:MAG: hypothetical protein LH472_16780 [Pyrinomonadaceae bacterium]|nr:hypothetical protein [Pyrinomonadaceae bacterium]
MIRLKQPALALHSHDVPGYRYKMQTTWLMPKNAAVNDVVYWIDWAIRNSANQRLENVVINCHGKNGFLAVGGKNKGFGKEGIQHFYKFRGKNAIGKIWLVACDVGAGFDFCGALAKATDCQVIAGKTEQWVEDIFEFFCPDYFIDNFEDGALYFTPDGQTGSFINSLGKAF